jgi:hypothetical protein
MPLLVDLLVAINLESSHLRADTTATNTHISMYVGRDGGHFAICTPHGFPLAARYNVHTFAG